MKEIPLESVPNQKFNVTLDSVRYTIRLITVNGLTCADISRDDTQIIQGVRCVPGELLLPYTSMDAGNFVFVTDSDDYPVYTEFGSTQFLYYLTQEEVEVFRAS